MKEIIQLASDFKRKTISTYQSITYEDIDSKISNSDLIVTTKIDGQYNLLYFDGENTSLIGSMGDVKKDLPILLDLTKRLKEKAITSLKVAVELCTKEERSRVFKVAKALSEDISSLDIKAFEILELNNEEYKGDYASKLEKLQEIFENNVVESKSMSKEELKEYFEQKITKDGHEGLIVRSLDFPIVYKIKPKHSLDLAIIGYTQEEEKVRELLVCAMTKDEEFMQVGIVGNGLDENTKQELFEKLKQEHTQSKFIEIDKRRIAFHMVKPKLVVEVSVNEVISENSKGSIRKAVLIYDEDYGYTLKTMTESVSLIHPIVKGIREDKQVNQNDVRWEQISQIVYIENKNNNNTKLENSQIIFRKVYTKVSKEQTSVKKFLIIKTNKENQDKSYPAYVFHFTDFSPTRKDPLKKDIRVSNSKEQIEKLCDEYIQNDIKKGWTMLE